MQNDTDKKIRFKRPWLHYVLQSALAAAVLAVLFLVLGEDRMVLISAIGASAFIVFAMPGTSSARTKVVIASHMIGLLSGAIFALTALPYSIECPIALAIAIFFMVIFHVQHPPAAGTAIAAVTNNASPDVWATVIVSVVVLSLARYLLKKYLRNLL